jgi:hypothetical protein
VHHEIGLLQPIKIKVVYGEFWTDIFFGDCKRRAGDFFVASRPFGKAFYERRLATAEVAY